MPLKDVEKFSPHLADTLKGMKVGHVWRPGPGCRNCWKGYRGRSVLCELMPMSDKMRKILDSQARYLSGQGDVHKDAGFVSLTEKALKMVVEGITSIDEAQRVVNLLET